MWLMRDEAWTVFDWKPIAECLEDEYRSELMSGKIVTLSDEEYEDYSRTVTNYSFWQDKLAKMLDSAE